MVGMQPTAEQQDRLDRLWEAAVDRRAEADRAAADAAHAADRYIAYAHKADVSARTMARALSRSRDYVTYRIRKLGL